MLGFEKLLPKMEGSKGSDDLSRRFVSQREVDERNKKRQEEWERVRKPEDPIGLIV